MTLVLVVQLSYASNVSVFGFSPDLILLVLVYIGLSRGQMEAVLFGFFAGFIQDVYSAEPLGINALSKSLVGFAVGYGRGNVVIESSLVRAFIIFGTVVLHDIIYLLCYSVCCLSRDVVRTFFAFFQQGVGTALYSTVLGVAIWSFAALGLKRDDL